MELVVVMVDPSLGEGNAQVGTAGDEHQEVNDGDTAVALRVSSE